MKEIPTPNFDMYASFLRDGYEINFFSDGTRMYSRLFVDQVDQAAIKFRKKYSQMPEIKDLTYEIGQKLSESTNDFSGKGDLKINGPFVRHFIDTFLFIAAKKGTGLEGLRTVAEVTVATAIKMFNSDINYSNYQTDISITGEGHLDAAFSMEISFRPIPKNIKLTEAE